MMRWIKTAENATDYSIMNTARQLLWLPTTREEKYKAKQAIDTFFVRGGDVLSAGVVYAGTHLLPLSVSEFAVANVMMTMVWLAVAYRIASPSLRLPQVALRHAACLAIALAAVIVPASAQAQDTREEQLAAARAAKAADLNAYEPEGLERQLQRVERIMSSDRPVYPFIGSIFEGGGLAVGPGYRRRVGDTGHFNAYAAYSYRSYKGINATLDFPSVLNDRLTFRAKGQWLDAPAVSFFGVGNETAKGGRTDYGYRQTSAGLESRLQIARNFAAGVGMDVLDTESTITLGTRPTTIDPAYRVSRAFAEYDSRTSPAYTRSGGLYRFDYADYHQSNGSANSFRRVDAELQQYVPLRRENWVIALRALASTTDARNGAEVPFFLMPELGGHHYLRGYSSFRFRDNNRLLFSGEYRWAAGPFVDMALFMDAGKVAPRLGDLNFNDLKTSRGLGVTFHTPRATVARFEIARSKEGTSFIASFSPSF
jgi:hypothetical protein